MADVAGRTTGVSNKCGTCTQHNQAILPQQNSEVVNLTGLAENKGFEARCEKKCLLAVNGKEQGIADVYIIKVEKGLGSTVH